MPSDTIAKIHVCKKHKGCTKVYTACIAVYIDNIIRIFISFQSCLDQLRFGRNDVHRMYMCWISSLC